MREAELFLAGKLGEAQAKIAFEILRAVAMHTPVDTGRCQQNWYLTTSATVRGDRGNLKYKRIPYTKDNRHGDRRGRSLQSVVSKAKADMKRLGPKLAKGHNNIEPIYVQNPTPYLRYLEAGHSRQAPAGFVKYHATMQFREWTAYFNEVLGDSVGIYIFADQRSF